MKQFKLYKHIKKIISYCIIAFLLIGTVGCQKTNRFETSDEVDFYVLGSDGIIGYQFNDEKLNEITKTDIKIINTKLDNRNQVKIKKISMIFHGFYYTLKIPEEKALFFRVV